MTTKIPNTSSSQEKFHLRAKDNVPSNTTLLLAKVIFRNGKQPPIDNTTFFEFLKRRGKFELEPYNVNDLAQEGKEDMYTFGIKLRRWYQKQIFGTNNQETNKNQVHIESTKHKACEESAKLVADGIFKHDFKKSIDGKHSSSSSMTTINDTLLSYFYSNDNECRMPWSLQQNIGNNFSSFRPYYGTRNKIAENLKVSRGGIQPQHMWKINDYYKSMRFSGQELPEWLTEDMLLDMDDSDRLFMKILFSGSYITQISGGVYANMVLDKFQQKSTERNNNEPRLELLCASEIIVAASISALTSAKTTASTKCGEDFAVVPKPGVLFWNFGSDAPQELKYKYCNEGCPLDQFQQLLGGIIIKNRELENCGVPLNNK
ncbi:uncharacterized protein LOC113388397 [Ctenocephalides felis]|uniref:uncharacterized protein LOC113388397 n=1 Tax=Ctenocephalides felis TaxID=7515 RepID=UPI000E6E230C|nr:uncharacterized protein LOC113388397 [Ctenocephalides felis]